MAATPFIGASATKNRTTAIFRYLRMRVAKIAQRRLQPDYRWFAEVTGGTRRHRPVFSLNRVIRIRHRLQRVLQIGCGCGRARFCRAPLHRRLHVMVAAGLRGGACVAASFEPAILPSATTRCIPGHRFSAIQLSLLEGQIALTKRRGARGEDDQGRA